jgi:hypothetical protein
MLVERYLIMIEMSNYNLFRHGISAAAWRPALAGALILALGGCDNFLDVNSPSLAEEQEVHQPGAVASLLRGTEGDFANAAAGQAGRGGIYLAGALLTDELVHSGVYQPHRGFSDGFSKDYWDAVEQTWAAASQARWTAENLIPRITRLMEQPASGGGEELEEQLGNQRAAAMLWAGFANRLMGDSFCQAVIDQGPLQDHTVFYQRAEKHFSDAIAAATELGRDTIRQAAQAGRAQTRMMLGNWQGAVEDAGKVENLLLYQHRHGGFTGREREWNWIRVSILLSNADVTVWGTPFATLARRAGTTIGDPRVTYDLQSTVPFGSDGRRPFWRQTKHVLFGGAIAVAKGTEMRLIEAEAALRGGNWQGAVAKINEVRTFHNSTQTVASERVPLVTATNLNQAWELLMRERGIVMWLEGRRLPDMRRWARQPGFASFQVVREAGSGGPTTDAVRNVLNIPDAMCIPVSRQEKRTNPNTGG